MDRLLCKPWPVFLYHGDLITTDPAFQVVVELIKACNACSAVTYTDEGILLAQYASLWLSSFGVLLSLEFSLVFGSLPFTDSSSMEHTLEAVGAKGLLYFLPGVAKANCGRNRVRW
jgi:hypothetical protein